MGWSILNLRTFHTHFWAGISMYTCMHAFARLITSHNTVKVHDVTPEHCAQIRARKTLSFLLPAGKGMCKTYKYITLIHMNVPGWCSWDCSRMFSAAARHLSTHFICWNQCCHIINWNCQQIIRPPTAYAPVEQKVSGNDFSWATQTKWKKKTGTSLSIS